MHNALLRCLAAAGFESTKAGPAAGLVSVAQMPFQRLVAHVRRVWIIFKLFVDPLPIEWTDGALSKIHVDNAPDDIALRPLGVSATMFM